MNGTPKTLRDAITKAAEAINELSAEAKLDHRLGNIDIVMLETHIRDFLAQKFSAAILNAAETPTEKELSDLWQSISAA